MPFSHCPISRSAFGHHDRLRSSESPPPARECAADEIAITFGGKNGDFRARLREFKLGWAAQNWVVRAAGNGVNGSLILSRGSAECLMDVFSLRGGLHALSSLLPLSLRILQDDD